MPNQNPTHEEIAARAHDIWERAGCPEGQETEHWLQAERELSQNRPMEIQTQRGSGDERGSSPRKRSSGY